MGENLPALSSPFPTEFAPTTKQAHWTGSGYAYRFRFPNNFGASVIPDRSSWELAVLEFTNSDAWELCYSTVVTDDVLPGLSEQKSTRLNSSHVRISYAVFCLKNKKRRGR